MAFLGIGRDRVWEWIAGPPDLGPIAFETLERPETPNTWLVCPDGLCRAAIPDAAPPVFLVGADTLRAAVREIALAEPRTTLVARDDAQRQDRFIQRTNLMRFPDTISVRAIPVDGDRSTLAVYSRSQIGRSDFGVNRRRVERWMQRLRTLLPVAG